MTTPGPRRRIIESQMPLTALSEHSRKGQYVSEGNPALLHNWWARRPLAACRASVFAALVPEPEDPTKAAEIQRFIAALGDWRHSLDSTNPTSRTGAHTYIRDARAMIRAAFPDRPPRVLDPFAGGGAIPLEALRLGCETYALDLNPVAHIIQLATLVYPQEYAHQPGPYGDAPGATLAGDVRKWGQWALDRARKQIGDLYPTDPDGATPVAYLWARTVPCPNADCRIDVPLIRQTWLAKKPGQGRSPGRYVAYSVDSAGPGSVPYYRVAVHDSPTAFGFDPSRATSKGGVATCPGCGTPLAENYIKDQASSGNLGAVLTCIVTDRPGGRGRNYRDVATADVEAYRKAAKIASDLKDHYDQLSGALSPTPAERVEANSRYAVPPMYGLDEFQKLFNDRQLVAMATFTSSVREAHAAMLESGVDKEYATAVATTLALAVDRLAENLSSLSRWSSTSEKLMGAFGRPAIAMVWDYCEANPFGGSVGDFFAIIDNIAEFYAHVAATDPVEVGHVARASAMQIPYPDAFFDAVVTDPPYYDNIPYAVLSDYFYVWLRRSIASLHPAILGTPLTPKQQEIIQDPASRKTKADFERMLGTAFTEIARVVRNDGIVVVVYAHTAISAWESLVSSLLVAGLTVNGSWPFSTEMASRLRSQNSAALASSIFLVCRKRRVDAGVGYADEVRAAIEANVHQRLDQFWDAGLRGADFFISAIGPATEAFSRYDKVMTFAGNQVTVSTLLEWVQQTVADYALRRVFAQADQEQGLDAPDAGLGEVDDQTRFYVLWRWTYDGLGSTVGASATDRSATLPTDDDDEEATLGETEDLDFEMTVSSTSKPKKDSTRRIPFGDAHLMATALGADVNSLLHRDHILDGRDKVRLLTASERQDLISDFGEPRADGSRPPLIDILHRAQLLWAAGRQDTLAEYLADVLPGDREPLRRVAQALIDILPRGDLEKQRLEGFLDNASVRDDASGTPPARAASAVQPSLGEDFGQPDRVIRSQPRRRNR